MSKAAPGREETGGASALDAAGVGLSVIVPAFNERRRIGASLRAIADYLAGWNGSSELVVVDDGSRDGTFDLVCQVARELPVEVRVARCSPNRGKGHALKVGFELARGERLLFTDADLSVSIDQAGRLLAALERGFDVAIGSRWVEGAKMTVRQPWYRLVLGSVYTLLVCLMVTWVHDATCGFKAFRREAGRDLFGRMRIDGWSFDAELLWLVRRRGYSMQEEPVLWRHRADTKVRLTRDGIRAFAGLLRIWWNALSRAYREPWPAERPAEIWESKGRQPQPSGGRSASGEEG